MKTLLALLKSSLVTLLIVLMFSAVTRHMNLPQAHDEHLTAMTYHKQVPLTNENLVDVLTEHVDTRNLHAIHLKHDLLEVELLLDAKQATEEQIYNVVPLYVALAFHYSNNVEHLTIKVMRQGKHAFEHIQLLKLMINREDGWLKEGVQQLKEYAWLDDPYWIKVLRIEKTVFWQTNYEI